VSSVVREYTSFAELLKSIDESLNTLKQQLAEYLRRLEDVRAKSEQEKKLKELLKRLTGEESTTTGKVIDMRDVKLFINPDAEQEAKLLEDIIDRINKSIQSLQSIRKTLEPLSNIEVETKITTIYREGVPVAIIIKLST
jgi:vacuolar-type H+-ATPase subunit I/STV1